jgi:stage II sporulation protein AA (anti-sigma F factor antagonist)
MQISIDEEGGSTARVSLVGRLDIKGAEVIAMPLATLSGQKQNILLDMSGVSFLASIGIRYLVTATKSLTRRGGKLILVSPTEIVAEVLTTAGIADIIPMVGSESEARALLA